jgi:hypothetical protein
MSQRMGKGRIDKALQVSNAATKVKNESFTDLIIPLCVNTLKWIIFLFLMVQGKITLLDLPQIYSHLGPEIVDQKWV